MTNRLASALAALLLATGLVSFALAAPDTAAQPPPATSAPDPETRTLQSYWDAARHGPGCEIQNLRDLRIVRCGLITWWFTKPNHPAHPGFIRREAALIDSAWTLNTTGRSYGPDEDQPKFVVFMNQILELNRLIEEEIREAGG